MRPVAPAAEEDPVLKQDDVIRMSVFEEPDLDVNTRVMKSGAIALPLIVLGLFSGVAGCLTPFADPRMNFVGLVLGFLMILLGIVLWRRKRT